MEKLTTIEALEQLGYTKADLERQFREATKRGEESLKHDPRAVSASYQNGEVTVRLMSGWSFSFDPRRYKFLKNATDEELSDVQPLGFGFALEWASIDQHLGVGPLILDLIGEKYLAKEHGRRNGSATSEKKKTTSRSNGKLGGRPKKNGKKAAE
jgi:hypothetical protein